MQDYANNHIDRGYAFSYHIAEHSLLLWIFNRKDEPPMITKDMSIGQVLQMDRGTAKIFMEFGMHCLGCPHATSESIEQAGAVHGINVDELVHQLNEHLAEKAGE